MPLFPAVSARQLARWEPNHVRVHSLTHSLVWVVLAVRWDVIGAGTRTPTWGPSVAARPLRGVEAGLHETGTQTAEAWAQQRAPMCCEFCHPGRVVTGSRFEGWSLAPSPPPWEACQRILGSHLKGHTFSETYHAVLLYCSWQSPRIPGSAGTTRPPNSPDTFLAQGRWPHT